MGPLVLALVGTLVPTAAPVALPAPAGERWGVPLYPGAAAVGEARVAGRDDDAGDLRPGDDERAGVTTYTTSADYDAVAAFYRRFFAGDARERHGGGADVLLVEGRGAQAPAVEVIHELGSAGTRIVVFRGGEALR